MQGLADTSTFLSYFMSVGVALGIVLLLAWVTIRFLAGRFGVSGKGDRNIKIIETMPLGPKRGLHIVEVGGKVLLIGSSEGGLTLLDRLERDCIAVTPPPTERRRRKFLEFLKKK